jgi:Uma2 family endonuclease
MSTTTYPPLQSGDRIGRFTTDQYVQMIKTGIIQDGAPYELLDGILVLKDRSKLGGDIMSVYEPHCFVIAVLGDLNVLLRGRGCFMRLQNPIFIPPQHAPEPDGAIVKGTPLQYLEQRQSPLTSEVSSVIEVSHSSLRQDRTDKGPKYAEAGIPQFVIVNLIDIQVEVREKPDTAKRSYSDVRIVKPGEIVPFLLPDGSRLEVPVIELLPDAIR